MKKILFPALILAACITGCTREVPAGNPLLQGWSYAVGSQEETPLDCGKKDFQNIDFLRNLERFLPDKEGFIWLKKSGKPLNIKKRW